jgi:hypothetical protein
MTVRADRESNQRAYVANLASSVNTLAGLSSHLGSNTARTRKTATPRTASRS